jgi:hypothetical protein
MPQQGSSNHGLMYSSRPVPQRLKPVLFSPYRRPTHPVDRKSFGESAGKDHSARRRPARSEAERARELRYGWGIEVHPSQNRRTTGHSTVEGGVASRIVRYGEPGFGEGWTVILSHPCCEAEKKKHSFAAKDGPPSGIVRDRTSRREKVGHPPV